jgi:flavin-dependent dehydrogenase
MVHWRNGVNTEEPPEGAAYDIVVVGARPAGAGTALLLARQGLRVLVVDRGQYGADTLSTHALMRAGVLQLARWGVLPHIVAASTPAIRAATFVYGDESVRVPVLPRNHVDALYAPRRTILDRAIVDLAGEAGATFWYGTTAIDLERDRRGRISGLVVRRAAGETIRLRTGLVIGADGLRSTVSRLVGAEVIDASRDSAATVFGYWAGVPMDGYRWCYLPGMSAGVIPTNDGLTCIFASIPTSRFAEVFRHDTLNGYRQLLDSLVPDLSPVLRGRAPVEPLSGWPGHPGLLRQAIGPGWALVGDAGYFKDPLTAHGITDALIEAEYLAGAIVRGTDAALQAYAVDRHRRTREIAEVTDRIASFTWTLDDARLLHKRLAVAMAEEVKVLRHAPLETILV